MVSKKTINRYIYKQHNSQKNKKINQMIKKNKNN